MREIVYFTKDEIHSSYSRFLIAKVNPKARSNARSRPSPSFKISELAPKKKRLLSQHAADIFSVMTSDEVPLLDLRKRRIFFLTDLRRRGTWGEGCSPKAGSSGLAFRLSLRLNQEVLPRCG